MQTTLRPGFATRPSGRQGVRRRCRVVVGQETAALRRQLINCLTPDGYDVRGAANGGTLVAHLASSVLKGGVPAELVVASARLRGWSGLELYKGMRDSTWETAFVLTVERTDVRSIDAARQLGIRWVLAFPFELDDFRTVVLHAALHPSRHRSGERYDQVGRTGLRGAVLC